MIVKALILLGFLLHSFTMANSFKPYVLADANKAASDVRGLQEQLKNSGFEVLGVFSPAKDYTTVAFTHADLKKEAAMTDVPMGAVLRASLYKNEVSYCDAHYWSYASNLKGKAADKVAELLQATFGKKDTFGCAKGKTEKSLRNFQYTMGMPRLKDVDMLGTFDSFREARDAIDHGISATSDVEQVYALDLDKKTRVIGLAMKEGKGSDSTVLGVTDTGKGPKMGGNYGPYELFIRDGKVFTTKGRFRIAVAFPDLSMGTFMKIVSAPGAILENAKKTVTSALCLAQ
jgi:hypothetical protein